MRQYIFFHNKRYPLELESKYIEQFLNHIAANKHCAASSQSQALNALVSLYREVLEQEVPWVEDLRRVKQKERLPVILTPEEIKRIFEHLNGIHALQAGLIYSGGA